MLNDYLEYFFKLFLPSLFFLFNCKVDYIFRNIDLTNWDHTQLFNGRIVHKLQSLCRIKRIILHMVGGA